MTGDQYIGRPVFALILFNLNSHLSVSFSLFLACVWGSLFHQTAYSMESIQVKGRAPSFYQTLMDQTSSFFVDTKDQIMATQPVDFLQQVPGLDLNGQGGAMQMYSIRGLSKNRVQTLVDGVPIYTERRAGAGAEFLPGQFVSSVNVVYGSASSYFGSGAMGGAVDFRLGESQQSQITASYKGNSNVKQVSGQWFHQGWTLAGMLADSNNGVDASSNPLNNGYHNRSALIHYTHDSNLEQHGWLLLSQGRDINKSNSDYPDKRITNYPNNDHALFKYQHVVWGGTATVHGHDSKLVTEVDSLNGEVAHQISTSTDLGMRWLKPWSTKNFKGNWSVSASSRQGVRVVEEYVSYGVVTQAEHSALDSSQHQWALHLDGKRQWGQMSLALASRWESVRQRADISVSDSQWSLWLGSHYELAPRWALKASLSNAYRVPSLTERFFNGVTPRGRTQGNTGLQSETSLGMDASLTFFDTAYGLDVNAYYQSVDDYIERYEVSQGIRSYHNIDKGRIHGLEIYVWRSFEDWLATAHWQTSRGRSENGVLLADIPPWRLAMSVSYQSGDWKVQTDVNHRASLSDFSEGEQALKSATTVNASVNYQWRANVKIKLSVNNLTNADYLTTQDDKSPYSEGRSIGIAVQFELN